MNNLKVINKDDNSILRWRFDVNTFRLLGRELITDRITAVFELVKNSYDANSTEVSIDFYNVSKNSENKRIVISDNGIGMSFSDIRDKWMVVGTNSKRRSLYSDPPFNRKFVGEKGIGRFAVEKLGQKLLIRTKQKGQRQWLNVEIDWEEYEKAAINSMKGKQISLFTEIDNEYFFEDGDLEEQGTSLIISKITEIWSVHDIERTYRELSKIISPFHPIDPPFEIYINSNEYEEYTKKPVKPDPVRFFSHYGEINFDPQSKKQQTLRFDENTGKIYTEWIDFQKFGPIKSKFYYFDEAAKKRYNAFYKNDFTKIDGVKIYRDGIITTPFAEYEDNPNKKRDILGIDKRRWRASFDKVGTREIVGIVEITKENNPQIIDATNRQDFLDNEEYRRLKDFIIEQVDVFAQVKDFERDSKRTKVERELQRAGQEVKKFENNLRKIEEEIAKDSPQFANVFVPLRMQAEALSKTISQSIAEQKKFQKDVARKESIFLSLMSLQDYATNISHAVRTSLGKIKRMAEFFKMHFPSPKYDALFKQYAELIYEEMETLLKVTDFMLSYARADIEFEDFSVKDLLEELLLRVYRRTFEEEGIKAEVEIQDDFILSTNKKFFQDIFQNLVSNSIKALKNKKDKIIKCSGFLDTDNFTLYFSDNGVGVDPEDKEWIFGIYNTRTADQGGAGLGLFIVEKRIEALKGSIELVENEFKPTGATFKITLPFGKI